MVESSTPSPPQPSGEGLPPVAGASPAEGIPAPVEELSPIDGPVDGPVDAPIGGPVEVPVALPVSAPPVASPQPIPPVATTLHAPATSADPEAGGEWALLVAKVKDWIGSGQLQDTLKRYRGPLQSLGVLLGAVVILRLYGALLGAIESLPLVPGLLELAGLLWLAGFAASNLVRSDDRHRLVEGLEKRWQSFRGRA